MMKGQDNDMSRREFLRRLGMGAGSAMALMALEPLNALAHGITGAAEGAGMAAGDIHMT